MELVDWAHGHVTLRWNPDSAGTGELCVDASSPRGFAGRGCAWFNQYKVAEFSERLLRYPLDPDRLPSLAGGWSHVDGPLNIQVGVRVYPVGHLGQLGIAVELASMRWDQPPMRPEETERVQLELLTTYQRLGDFARDCQKLLAGVVDMATVGAERLA